MSLRLAFAGVLVVAVVSGISTAVAVDAARDDRARTIAVPANSAMTIPPDRGRTLEPGLVHVQKARVTRVLSDTRLEVAMTAPSRHKAVIQLIGVSGASHHGCGQATAQGALRRSLPHGTRVELVPDPGLGRLAVDGQLSRFVSRRGDDVGAILLSKGLVRFNPKRISAPTWKRFYRHLQSVARRKGTGIWKDCDR